MNRRPKNILITGLPGVGKTTLIKRLRELLADRRPVGFYTAEIREGGVRKGFKLVDLGGEDRILSHVDFSTGFRVGKYGVDVAGFEDYLAFGHFDDPTAGLVLIDEIGKMECLSAKFVELIIAALNSEKPVLATIALKGGGVIEEIKRRDDVCIFHITPGNRDSLVGHIHDYLRRLSR